MPVGWLVTWDKINLICPFHSLRINSQSNLVFEVKSKFQKQVSIMNIDSIGQNTFSAVQL